VRFAILYFFMLIVFLALIIGPIFAGKFVSNLPSIPLQLLQPTGQNNNDTSNKETGTALNGGSASTSTVTAKVRFF
jgi:1,3-beta-glucan synthase